MTGIRLRESQNTKLRNTGLLVPKFALTPSFSNSALLLMLTIKSSQNPHRKLWNRHLVPRGTFRLYRKVWKRAWRGVWDAKHAPYHRRADRVAPVNNHVVIKKLVHCGLPQAQVTTSGSLTTASLPIANSCWKLLSVHYTEVTFIMNGNPRSE